MPDIEDAKLNEFDIKLAHLTKEISSAKNWGGLGLGLIGLLMAGLAIIVGTVGAYTYHIAWQSYQKAESIETRLALVEQRLESVEDLARQTRDLLALTPSLALRIREGREDFEFMMNYFDEILQMLQDKERIDRDEDR